LDLNSSNALSIAIFCKSASLKPVKVALRIFNHAEWAAVTSEALKLGVYVVDGPQVGAG
jgi:hypothetical protein